MILQKKILIIIYSIVFMFVGTLKSNAGDLYGYIYDSTNDTPLEFVNIVLMKTDSSFVAGSISNEKGDFHFNSLIDQEYILKISYVGYKTYFRNIVTGKSNEPELIRLEPTEMGLKEVVITSTQPTFKSAPEGIIANVSLSNLKNVGTANDVIQRMPGIIYEDEKISVFGKGTPIVYINNRKINDLQELDRLLSEDISTVELLTNPSAKYSAEGRAVLIIKTKIKQNGFSAIVSEKIRIGTKLGDAENVNISYSKDRINLFASYFHDYRNIKTKDRSIYNLNSEKDESEHDFFIVDRYPANYYSASTGLDISLDNNHSIGIQYQYNTNYAPHAKSTNDNISNLYGQIPDTTLIQTQTNDKFHRSLINAFYRGKLSEKLLIHSDFDYLNNKTKRQADHSEYHSLYNSELEITSKSDYRLWAAKITMEYKPGFGIFEFGSEYNQIKGNGSIIGNGPTFENSIYSSKEQKAAFFLIYTHIIKGYNLRAGLRYEFSDEKNKDDILNQNKVNRKYNELYPNLSISKKIEETQLSFLFSKKVSRPSITELYNNTAYVNQYILQKGNPYLVKTDIYDVNFQAQYKMLYFNLGYSYFDNPIAFYSENEPGSDKIITTVTNYDKFQNINATINFNHKLSFWQPNYTVSLTKPFFSSVYNGREISHNKLSLFIKAYNDFVLPKKIVLSANYTLTTDCQYMLIDIGHYQILDLGIRKLLLDDKLKLNLEVLDVFNWLKQNNSLKINNLNLNQHKKRESRFVLFTVSYQINNYKKSYRGANAANSEIRRF